MITCACPPNYPNMDNAVDAVLADKFGPDGIYRDEALFRRIYNGEFGDRDLDEARQRRPTVGGRRGCRGRQRRTSAGRACR